MHVLTFFVIALLSLITPSLSTTIDIPNPTCKPASPPNSRKDGPQAFFPFVPQAGAQQNIASFCNQMAKDHIDDVNNLRKQTDDHYAISYRYPALYGRASMIATKLWLKVSAADKTGNMPLDQDTCNRALSTVLNGCPPFTIEPHRNKLYKYGGSVGLTGDAEGVEFSITVVPDGKGMCLELGYPSEFCVDGNAPPPV